MTHTDTLFIYPSALADVLGVAESTLRAARYVTGGDLGTIRDGESPRQRAILFDLEAAVLWARAHAGLTDAQEAELRRRALPIAPSRRKVLKNVG